MRSQQDEAASTCLAAHNTARQRRLRQARHSKMGAHSAHAMRPCSVSMENGCLRFQRECNQLASDQQVPGWRKLIVHWSCTRPLTCPSR